MFPVGREKGIEFPYQSVEELERHFLNDVKDLDSFFRVLSLDRQRVY